MKIKDILDNISNIRHKAIYAKCIRNSNPIIKNAIVDFHLKGSFEPITYGIKTNNVLGILSISTTDLQKLYGMKPLEALLFLDAIVKADSNSDKTQLINLLQSLVSGKHRGGPIVTPQMLETIKETNPEVWTHYKTISENAQKEETEAIEEMNTNLNEEL